MGRRVILVEHNPDWPRLAREEADRIREALGDVVLSVHHVGSTSIPGIQAKPILDLLGVVTALEALAERASSLERLGYEVRGEAGIPGRQYFSKATQGVRTHHLHCFAAGHPEIERHLLFRDYLTCHPQVARAYERVKVALAGRFPNDSEAYCEAKTPFIEQADDGARAWAASQGRPVQWTGTWARR